MRLPCALLCTLIHIVSGYTRIAALIGAAVKKRARVVVVGGARVTWEHLKEAHVGWVDLVHLGELGRVGHFGRPGRRHTP